VQQKLVDILSEIKKAQLLALRLGRLKEAGKHHFTHVSLAKAQQRDDGAAGRAHHPRHAGRSGITDEYVCGRHMANLESVVT